MANKPSKYSNKKAEATAPVVETPSTVDIVTAAANVAAVQNDVTARKGHVSALAFVRAGGLALSNMLAHYADAKEAETQGPIETYAFLDLKLNDESRNIIPVVGSKQGETGNNPYDRYTQEVVTKDGKKKVPGSWFTDVVRNTQACIALEQRVQVIDGMTDDDTPAELIAEIAAMGAGQKAQERKRLLNRKGYMRYALTRGAMLWHHVEEIDRLNPAKISVLMPIKEDQSERGYRIFNNVIRVIDPSKELEDKVYTVSEFLALDPAKIPAGTEANLVSLELTKARKPRAGNKGGQASATAIPVPRSLEALLNLFNICATSLDQNTDEGKMLYSKVLAACAAPGEKGDDAVETIGDFINNLDDNIWGIINARYDLIKSKKAKAQNIKAQATANAAA